MDLETVHLVAHVLTRPLGRVEVAVGLSTLILVCMRVFAFGLFKQAITFSNQTYTRLSNDYAHIKSLRTDYDCHRNLIIPTNMTMQEAVARQKTLSYAKNIICKPDRPAQLQHFYRCEGSDWEHVSTLELTTRLNPDAITALLSGLLTPVISFLCASQCHRLFAPPSIRSAHGALDEKILFLFTILITGMVLISLIQSLPVINLNHYLPAWSRISCKPSYTMPMLALHQAIAKNWQESGDEVFADTRSLEERCALVRQLLQSPLMTREKILKVIQGAQPLRRTFRIRIRLIKPYLQRHYGEQYDHLTRLTR